MKKKYMKWMYNLDILSVILLIAGGLNWGLIGLFNYNLVADILPGLADIIYSAVGIGSVWILYRSVIKKFMKK